LPGGGEIAFQLAVGGKKEQTSKKKGWRGPIPLKKEGGVPERRLWRLSEDKCRKRAYPLPERFTTGKKKKGRQGGIEPHVDT